MLIKVLDGLGVQQTMIVATQESVTDRSGTIAGTGVSQQLMAANVLRSGQLMQNISANPMYVNAGADAAVGVGFVVQPGDFFPPAGFPVTTQAWNITGTATDKFTCKEW